MSCCTGQGLPCSIAPNGYQALGVANCQIFQTFHHILLNTEVYTQKLWEFIHSLMYKLLHLINYAVPPLYCLTSGMSSILFLYQCPTGHCIEGVSTLSCGVCACSGAGLSWGIYFTAYNSAKRRWQKRKNTVNLPPHLHLLSATEAGCIVRSLVTYKSEGRQQGSKIRASD
jgi:hypothetical protein